MSGYIWFRFLGGSTTQNSLIKKRKSWYIDYWSAGNEWIEDEKYQYKLNVVLETSDLDEIIRYVAKYNKKEIEHLLKDARVIYNEYLDLVSGFVKDIYKKE